MMMSMIVQAQRLPNRQRRVRVESCCLGGRRLFAWQVLKAVLVMMRMRMMRMMMRMMMMRMMMIHLWGWVSYLFHIFMGSFYCREFPMYSECLVISASFKNHKFLRSQPFIAGVTRRMQPARLRWSIIIPSPDPQLSDRPQNYHRPQLSSLHQMSKRSAHNRRIIGGRFVFGQTTPSDPSSPKLPLKRRSMSKQSGIGDNIVKPLNETSDCFSQQLHLSKHTNPQQTTQLKMHERNLKSW